MFLWILIALLAHICVLMLSRDAIIELRSVDSQLSAQVRSAVNRAGCGRRGCRAGQHVQRRKNAVAYIETDSTSGIPVVSAVHYRPDRRTCARIRSLGCTGRRRGCRGGKVKVKPPATVRFSIPILIGKCSTSVNAAVDDFHLPRCVAHPPL